MTKTISIALFVLLLCLSSTNSIANETGLICYERDKVEDLLKEKYKAKLIAMGVVSNGSLAQLYLEGGKDFHVIIIPPNNISKACPLLWGENWEWSSKFLDTLT